MPVAEFPGHHGWGYDGVYMSAPHSAYGGPEGLAALVAAAHEHELSVILDVVYNHVGASGVKALDRSGPTSPRSTRPLGARRSTTTARTAIPVREWVLQSAEGWVRDYGIDGLRLDAIHSIYDSSAEHIVAAIARRVHAVRDDALVIAESGLNDPRVMRTRRAGRLRLRRRLGRRLPSCAADPADRRSRGLLRRVRARGPAGQGVSPPACPRRQLLGVPPAAVRRAGRRRAAATVRGVLAGPRPGRQPRLRRPDARVRAPAGCVLRRCCRRSCRCCSWARSTARPPRFSSSPTTSTSGSPTPPARAAGASSPRSPSSARRFPTRRMWPRSSAPSSPAGATRRWPASTRELLAARRRLPPGDADEIEFDEAARWLRVRRGAFEILCNFAARGPGASRARGPARELFTHDAAADRRRPGRARRRCRGR